MKSDRRFESGSKGFSLIELVVVIIVLSIFLCSIAMATIGIQEAFLENQVLSQMRIRARIALDRIVHLSGQALTSDAMFSPLKPNTGIGSHCLRFRLVRYVDPVTATLVYEDTNRVYIYGPDSGEYPCQGLIIGRGPELSTIFAAGKGPDSFLGTTDDLINALSNGIPFVEILIPSNFAPQSGTMFSVDVTPAPIGRLLRFTLRLNARDAEGNFLFPNDVVFTERVALRE